MRPSPQADHKAEAAARHPLLAAGVNVEAGHALARTKPPVAAKLERCGIQGDAARGRQLTVTLPKQEES